MEVTVVHSPIMEEDDCLVRGKLWSSIWCQLLTDAIFHKNAAFDIFSIAVFDAFSTMDQLLYLSTTTR